MTRELTSRQRLFAWLDATADLDDISDAPFLPVRNYPDLDRDLTEWVEVHRTPSNGLRVDINTWAVARDVVVLSVVDKHGHTIVTVHRPATAAERRVA